MNSAMIEYENKVANWIKDKNKQGKDYHVLYRVTPIYEGENKLAEGVEIEAKSVEEEGIEFNKFVYKLIFPSAFKPFTILLQFGIASPKFYRF